MVHSTQILVGVLAIALISYVIVCGLHPTDTFGVWYNPCGGPCHRKGERDCCACAKCAWFIDPNYNGQCIRRGTGPDSCLMRPSYHHGHHYSYPTRSWYSQRRRPIVHRGPGWVKDSWGRWIRASPSIRRGRGRGRRRIGRRFHHR